MKLRLNRPAGHNRWCGPAAYSVITGATTNEAAAAIRAVSGQRFVKGVYTSHLREALLRAGWKTTRVQMPPQLTLAGWLKFSRTQRTAGRLFLVRTTTHFQIVSGRRYICNIVGEAVSVRDKRVKRRSRVKAVYEVSKVSQP